jgi:hypothetical protein
MSDWQRGVDCKCRLRLDWRWCRWITSTKGRCWWGLQVWKRQVGLVWETRWPAESSAGPMVARTVGRSRGRFLGWASKPSRAGITWEPSHEWWLAEATPSSRGLKWFTRILLSYSVEPQNRGRRLDEEVWPPRPVQPPGSQPPRSFETKDTRRDRKACVEAKQGCGRWASVCWRKSKDFQIRPWGACIHSYLVRVV